jgi:hypothetical protein
MTEEMRSRVLGMILGSVSRGQFPQREPIGYLYGHVAKEGETPTHTINGVGYVGVVAPGLPVVDGYDYMAISRFVSNGVTTYTADFTTVKLVSNEVAFGYRIGFDNSIYAEGYLGQYRLSESKWEQLAIDMTIDTSSDFFKYDTENDHLIWTNHDIVNEDGTVYLAAIEPIPIYE